MIRDTMIELRNFFSVHGFCADGAMARDAAGNEVEFNSDAAESFCFYGAIGRLVLVDNEAFPYDFDYVWEHRFDRARDLELAIWNYLKDDMGCSDEDMPNFEAIIISFQRMIGDDQEKLWRFLNAFDDQPVLAAAAD